MMQMVSGIMDILMRSGWIPSHAPDGVRAERIKYRTEDGEWLFFHLPEPTVKIDQIIDKPCILTFAHEPHRFAVSEGYIQQCPGVEEAEEVKQYWSVMMRNAAEIEWQPRKAYYNIDNKEEAQRMQRRMQSAVYGRIPMIEYWVQKQDGFID